MQVTKNLRYQEVVAAVALVVWEVLVMVDLDVMVLFIWAGGRAQMIEFCSPVGNSSSTPL